MTDNRAAFTEARTIGKATHQQQRLERARERPCLKFIHTDEDKDWTCVCGHGADDHGMSPSKAGGACQECATHTAAEVRVLTKQAGEYGYALGRKEAVAEFVAGLTAFSNAVDGDSISVERACRIARDIGKGDPT